MLVNGLPFFDSVRVFGDSLVDPGNALEAAEFVGDLPFVGLPDGAPTAERGYFQGRFTDGYTFADLIANKLLGQPTQTTFPYGLELPFGAPLPFVSRPQGEALSFAYGGAEAIGGFDEAPDLDAQVDAYRSYPEAEAGALHIVTIGGNDVRELAPKSGEPVTGDEATARLQAAAERIAREVGQLFDFGARHVLVTGAPDVGLIPSYAGALDEDARRSLATHYARTLDDLLQAALDNLNLPADAELHRVSLLAFSDAILADPEAFGFTDVTRARTDVQPDALSPAGGGFLFFDRIHPSAQAHAQLAAEILDSLRLGDEPDGPLPLPTPGLGAAVDAGGADSFTASLVAGRAYVFEARGVSSGDGSLADPRLRLLDPAGADVAEDDDAALGLDASFLFLAPASGDYTLQVSGVGVTAGSYVLRAGEPAGQDLLTSGALRGSDVTAAGGDGNDTLAALGGANYLRGGAGDDSILGGAGFDDINGNMGRDVLAGGAGGDWVVGGKDDDDLFGEAGGDIVLGNLGNDTCQGGAGDDVVRGGQGDDRVLGGDGADWLAGDLGADTLTGGAGADVFHAHGGAGLDLVTDFSRTDGDRVLLLAGSQYTLAQAGADVAVEIVGGGRLVLAGVQLSSLTGDWIG